LIAAADHGKDILLNMLAPRGSSVDADNDDYGSALQLACIKGHTGIVERLLFLGAAPNRVDEHGWTPLLCASQFEQNSSFNLLLSFGGDERLLTRPFLTLASTAWSNMEKSSRLELDYNGMTVRYVGKLFLLYPKYACSVNTLNFSSRYD
jgi:ankyrin repeat protein